MRLQKIFVGLTALFMANSMVISTGFAQETNQNPQQFAKKNPDSSEISPEEILKIENTVEKELKELEKRNAALQKKKQAAQNQQADSQKNSVKEADSQNNNPAQQADSQSNPAPQTDSPHITAQIITNPAPAVVPTVSSFDVKEENMATLTAEGDFLVPTYMLPAKEDLETVAETAAQNNFADNQMSASSQNVSNEGSAVQNVVQNAPNEGPVLQNVLAPNVIQGMQEVSQNAPVNGPVNKILHESTVKVTQTELTPVAEQMEIERFLTGKTTKTMKAYKEALARREAEEAETKAKAKVVGENGTENQTEANQTETTNNIDTLLKGKITKSTGKPKKRLLLPLRPLPAKTPLPEDLSGTAPLFKVVSSQVADQVLKDAQDQTQSSLLMPQDIKVTFYPESADFSGQSVKWIKAFALQALNDPRKVMEIRLSQYSPTVQQKRLYVIRRLLMNSGLSAHQIVVDYVDRPADSLILRTVEKIEPIQKRKIEMKNGKVKENETIIW